MIGSNWIWQQPDWPTFRWKPEPLAPLLRACQHAQGQLIVAAEFAEASLGTGSADLRDRNSIDQHDGGALDLARLLDWHASLLSAGNSRSRPCIRAGMENQIDHFLVWFASSLHDIKLDPLLRAGIAHFWFVTLHPFDDGNGRLSRAITDLALAQGEHEAIRFFPMSSSILDDHDGYYEVLQTSQRGDLDITAWLEWFLRTLLRSLEQALVHLGPVLAKARFWHEHRQHDLSAEQVNVLNHLLDGGANEFPHGISASQYQAVTHVSKATATRHLTDLLEKGLIERLPGGGRSTRYRVSLPEPRNA